MSKVFVKIAWLSALLSFCLGLSAYAAEDPGKREFEEAKKLFLLIRENPKLYASNAGKSGFQPCEYPIRWTLMSLPEHVARAEFGLRIHAELLGAEQGDLKSFLSRSDNDAAAFCTDEQADKLDQERMTTLEPVSQRQLMIYHSKFGFPIFDAGYEKAIVIIMHSAMMINLRASGGLAKSPMESVDFAAVFKKRNGQWFFVKTIELGIS